MPVTNFKGTPARKKGRSSQVAKFPSKCRVWGHKNYHKKSASHQEDSHQSVAKPVESKEPYGDRYRICDGLGPIVRRSDVVYYQGERLRDSEIVAVAVHSMDAGVDGGIPRGAIREILLLKDVQHPNIMQLMDECCDDHRAHVVFSRPGIPLPQYLQARYSGLNAEAIRSLSVQLLLGVEFCHAHGIVLSNLKPQNIFIDVSVCPPALRVGGFSTAQLLPLERRIVILRTAWYSSPELLMDSTEALCLEGDMWSVGCIFGELGFGRSLFPGDSEIGTLLLIFRQLGTPSEATWPGVTALPAFSHSFPKWKAQAWSQRIHSKVGLGGINLLDELLSLDPRDRPSARQALRHPWLCGQDTLTSPDVAKFRTRNRSVTKACSKHPFLHDADALALVESYVGRCQASQVGQYASDIDGYARNKEVFAVPRKDFWLGNETKFEEGLRCRSLLVDWMVDVLRKKAMKNDALFLAVAIVDQYIAKKQIASNKFQCLGCAGMLIATKIEDENVLEGTMLVDISDSSFTLAELMQMEVDILNTTQFNLRLPTVPYFLDRFSTANGSCDLQRSLAGYLAELTLLRIWDFQYTSSHIAAASIALSNRLLKRTVVWPPFMAARTGYVDCLGSEQTPSLEECVSKLLGLMKEIKTSRLQAITKKYACKLGDFALGEE